MATNAEASHAPSAHHTVVERRQSVTSYRIASSSAAPRRAGMRRGAAVPFVSATANHARTRLSELRDGRLPAIGLCEASSQQGKLED